MTKIHPHCMSVTTDGLRALTVRMIKGDDRDSVRNELRQLLRVKAKSGSPPLTKSEYRYAEPFLWDRLKELDQSDRFGALLDEVRETPPSATPSAEVESTDAAQLAKRTSLLPSEEPLHALAGDASPDQELEELENRIAELHGRLVELLSDETRDDMARTFVRWLLAEMERLPFSYTGIVPLPFTSEHVRLLGNSFELCSTTRIVQPNDEMLTWFDRLRFMSPMSDRQANWPMDYLDERRYYFSTKVSGYKGAALHVSDALFVDVSDLLKAFLGLCLACHVVEFAGPAEHEEVVMMADAGGVECDAVFLPEDEAAVYGALFTPPVTKRLLATAKRNLHAISTAFRKTDERLLSAGRWFFGSFCGSNELLKLVQATTTLEILLGDETDQASDGKNERTRKDAGITDLLASRCSYLIATSREERKSVERQFRKVYDGRSRAVHAGVNLLRDDIDQLSQALTLCKRVIQKELAVLTPLP